MNIFVKSFYPNTDYGFFPNDDSLYHEYTPHEFFNNFILSSYKLDYWRYFYLQMIDQYDNLEHIYVICPTYWLGYEKSYLPDYQICVTGKGCDFETPSEAIKREMGEELGLIPNRENLKYIYNDENTDVAMIDYTNCYHVINDKNVAKRREYYNIACFIHIDEEDIKSYCEHLTIRLYDKKEIALRFASIIPIELLNSIIIDPDSVRQKYFDHNINNEHFIEKSVAESYEINEQMGIEEKEEKENVIWEFDEYDCKRIKLQINSLIKDLNELLHSGDDLQKIAYHINTIINCYYKLGIRLPKRFINLVIFRMMLPDNFNDYIINKNYFQEYSFILPQVIQKFYNHPKYLNILQDQILINDKNDLYPTVEAYYPFLFDALQQVYDYDERIAYQTIKMLIEHGWDWRHYTDYIKRNHRSLYSIINKLYNVPIVGNQLEFKRFEQTRVYDEKTINTMMPIFINLIKNNNIDGLKNIIGKNEGLLYELALRGLLSNFPAENRLNILLSIFQISDELLIGSIPYYESINEQILDLDEIRMLIDVIAADPLSFYEFMEYLKRTEAKSEDVEESKHLKQKKKKKSKRRSGRR